MSSATLAETLTKKYEDFYPLTPFQQGILFHVLDTPKAGMFLNQQRYTFRGDLDLDAFKQALQGVMDRHQILRTSFVLSAASGPVQVVYRKLNLPWTIHDWSNVPRIEAAARVDAFQESDFKKNFDLLRAPLMRMTMIRVAPDWHEFIWSFHLLLMDGWSMQVILRELLALYHGFVSGQPANLPPPVLYRDFVNWLLQQPEHEAEGYWRKTLAEFTNPTPLCFDRMPFPGESEDPNFKETIALLDEASSDQVRAFSVQQRLTMNTVIQGAWALLLSRRSGTTDILFGTTVSGRSAAIPRIDSAVGVYVNVLPTRVSVQAEVSVTSWLREIQRRQAEARRFEFCSLARIQSWSEVPRKKPLFDSGIVFQNFPLMVSMPAADAALQVEEIQLIERNNIPLLVVITPGTQFHFRSVYMGSRFDDGTIDQILENFRRILVELTSNPDASVATISPHGDNERQSLIHSFNQSLASLECAE
jgi:hypothetical protein